MVLLWLALDKTKGLIDILDNFIFVHVVIIFADTVKAKLGLELKEDDPHPPLVALALLHVLRTASKELFQAEPMPNSFLG